MLSAGDAAPDFEAEADDGSTVRLADLRGRRVLIYFYPRDDTAGCTQQACSIRDSYADFEAIDAVVFGVSPDDVESHRRFRDKFSLPFQLLADTDHGIAEAYGVWVEKRNYGRTTMGIERSAFVIGPDGHIIAARYGVKPADTTAVALAALAASA